VLRTGAQHDFARHRGLDPAAQETLSVAAALAGDRQSLHLDLALIRVETADQPGTVRIGIALEHVDGDPAARDRLAGAVDGDHLEPQVVLRRDPAIGADPKAQCGWPE